MGMGNYDQSEYERREQAISEVDSRSEDQPTEYQGKVIFEENVSTEDLLRSLQQMKSEE
ncbi:DUF5786 family protein [Natronococcus occultus]|uniref:DUF5786 domain-containing protein n=1 Tax=Natronococcus occultus SP4 TaxID=694430 RepID=L0JYV1_9EURY|nr:DUF5786 family protein [Natronococcus occultus]AGB37043.1 hypothetical protein Natoc_1208 [Natronococcus occultus SP4]